MKETFLLFLLSILTISSFAQHFERNHKDTTAKKISTDALRAHTGFLAYDLLEGRGTASRGEALAALYLSSNLRAYGLKPITGDTTSDYRIPVPLTAYHFAESEARLRI